MKFLLWLKSLYQTNKKFRTVVQMGEGAAAGAFLSYTANGLQFTKAGLAGLVSAILTGLVTSLRNYLLTPANANGSDEGGK